MNPPADEPVAADALAMDDSRPAGVVMSSQRAAAAMPCALSFCRLAVGELVRGRWRIEKLRFALDDEGRGEILYRLLGAGHVFHFFLVSNKLDESVKTDRNFAASWDAMGVLCQGDWTEEREAHMRQEVPKQRAGFADYDTLIYARGNRSARLFDHVVDSLAAGRQPDPQVIAPVGYILRTTAFIGNGQLGTRPLAAYGPDHPLNGPYQVQFCSAFVLREYVFDLVDHIARSRNPAAARLSPEFRRYLGLGNSAATGLVQYLLNHPRQIHQWTLARERALAHALLRPSVPSDETTVHFAALIQKAVRYFREGAHASDGVFPSAEDLVADLRSAQMELLARSGTSPASHDHRDGAQASGPGRLIRWARHNVGAEAQEVLHSILLEIHPDIVRTEAGSLKADEMFTLQPDMPAAALRALIEQQYGWALEPPFRDARPACFWYRSSKAPRDLRRGPRDRVPAFETETTMDTLHRTQRLYAVLELADGSTPIAEIVQQHPDLRHVATRIQSLAGCGFGELRADWLSETFSPFGPTRFVLALFGLEKFEAALPKSVRGTFLQGAPIAEDVEHGIDGDWPFPLMPVAPPLDVLGATREDVLAPLPAREPKRPKGAPVNGPEARPVSIVTLAPAELARMVQTALQGHGAALGVAASAADAIVFAEACGQPALHRLLAQCAADRIRPASAPCDARGAGTLTVLDAGPTSALVAAPDALDTAMARAFGSASGLGASLVTRASHAWLCSELTIRCAARGCIALLLWRGEGADGTEEAGAGFAAAGPGEGGAWFVAMPTSAPAVLLVEATSEHAGGGGIEAALGGRFDARAWLAAASPAAATPEGDPSDTAASFLLICHRDGAPRSAALFETLRHWLSVSDSSSLCWDGAALRRRRQHWLHDGIPIARETFDALHAAGAALLVPDAEEHRVLPAGTDPIKTF